MRVSSLLAVLPVAQLGSAFVAPCACGTTQAIQNGQSSRCATQTKRGRATGRIRPAVRGTSMASSMASEPWTGEDKEISQEIPDDPEELMRMEREFYQNQQEFARLGELKKKLADMPKQKQCHRYRWTQTETTFDVEIPIHKPCDDEDLYLVVDKDQLQVAIKTDEPFGAITGVFPGDVDATSCSYRIHSRNDEPYIHLEIAKVACPGTYEFWSELLQGEKESPTIRFAGKTERYSWKQNAETVEVEIPVPYEVTKRKTTLRLDPSGAGMHLSFTNKPDFKPIDGKFKGLISPLDSVWMLDEGDSGKMLALTVKKRRDARDKTAWWSGVFEGDDVW